MATGIAAIGSWLTSSAAAGAAASAAAGAVASGVVGKIMEEDAPGKTEEQKKQESLAAEDARQQRMRGEREKIAGKRGASGRQTLTYKPQAMTTGAAGQSSKLGGGN